MRDCPNCGAAVDGKSCPSCGHGSSKANERAALDPDWWRCCDTDQQGNRCAKPGALSESTRGPDHRWYCHQHYPPFRARGYARSDPPFGWASIIRKEPKPVDFEAEAERIAMQA